MISTILSVKQKLRQRRSTVITNLDANNILVELKSWVKINWILENQFCYFILIFFFPLCFRREEKITSCRTFSDLIVFHQNHVHIWFRIYNNFVFISKEFKKLNIFGYSKIGYKMFILSRQNVYSPFIPFNARRKGRYITPNTMELL